MRFTTPIEFKAPEAGGEFAGYLAVIGTVDMGGDVIKPGAFAKTLAETKARGTPLPLFWNHDTSVVLGRFTDLAEDSKGLYAQGQLTLGTQAARETYALLKDRAVTGLSIGYSIADNGSKFTNGVRYLSQIDLFEGSLVAVPMHPDARIVSVKSLMDCADEHEVKNWLREHDRLSRRVTSSAAADLWRTLRGGGGGNDFDYRDLAKSFDNFTDTLKGK